MISNLSVYYFYFKELLLTTFYRNDPNVAGNAGSCI